VTSYSDEYKRTGSGAARMRPKRPCPSPKQTCYDFALVLYINLQLFENNRRNSWPRDHICVWRRQWL